MIPVSGLQRRDGRSAPMLRGADFLYLPARDGQGAGFAMVAGLEPFARADSRRSPGISEELGLAWLGEEDLWAGEGSWTPLARIRRDRTGYAFNFDAALVRDAYGQLPAGAPLTVVASVARRAPGRDLALWSYRLVSVACG